ncbi:hypothetical protein [Pontixanthobacter sp.]|uniref:hypothetical protein n=1 Tax=Pontixanthobacter sp. TaxID=2792078 RepID=UPI003C7E5AE9
MDAIFVALIGLIAALLGGAIQAYSTGRFQRSKFEMDAKWELYSSYFVTLGELSFARNNPAKLAEGHARMANIRGRIGIQGSPEVVVAVGNVFRFPDLHSDEAQEAMAIALSAMRSDLGKGNKTITKDMLKQIMFNSRDV